jgi:hypothetical protein
VAKGSRETDRQGDGDEKPEFERLKSAYLTLAREALTHAKALLEQNEGEQLVYAALELRRAFEALVYENALRFTDELVGEDYAVWQPAQLLEQLVEIDPVADAEMELRLQDSATGEWVNLGRQRRIGLKVLKKRYYALGNHLHTPALAQMMRGKRHKRASLLKLCNDCAELIGHDLDATLRIGRMAIFGNVVIECRGCGATIRRMLNALRTPRNKAPGTKEVIVAKCQKCPASYEIRADGDDAVRWREQRWMGHCPYPDCGGVHTKWAREVKEGMASACPSCGKKAVFTQTFAFLPQAFLKKIRKQAT